jgi:hypothetical protein
VFDDLRDGDIAGVAVAGVLPNADAQLGDALMDDLAHAAALGDDGDMAGRRSGECEIAIGADGRIGVDDSLAVRAEDANARLAGHRNQSAFQGRSFVADLPETGRVDDDGFDALGGAVLDTSRHQRVLDDDVGHVHRVGRLQDRWVGL